MEGGSAAAAVREALQDAARRRERIAAARRHARDHYDLEHMVDATLAACDALIGPFSGGAE
jgi:hypothetical protein